MTDLAATRAALTAPSLASRLRPYLPSSVQLLVAVVVVLCVSNAFTWFALVRDEARGAVTVVAVRQMTQNYLKKIYALPISPQEAAVRAQMFVAAAEEEMQKLRPAKGGLVLAKECVLAGESHDITDQLEAATERRLAQVTGGLAMTPGALAAPAVASRLGGSEIMPLPATPPEAPAAPAALGAVGALGVGAP